MDVDMLTFLMVHDHKYGKHAVLKDEDCPECKEAPHEEPDGQEL